MPLCTIHLLALHSTTPNPLSTFLSTLKSTPIQPLVVSQVIRWIILPTQLSTSHLLARNIAWDLLLILPNTSPLPPALTSLIHHHWTITAGIPSRLTTNFSSLNPKLLHPPPASIPPLSPQTPRPTTKSAQDLELSAELNTWIDGFLDTDSSAARGAVSMFNLLAFHPGAKPSYLQYGAAFAESAGARHGGNAKLVGSVTAVNGDPAAGADAWDEVALAQYPSIAHFRDMLCSEEYQGVNRRFRVGSLRDTAILMTSEVLVEGLVGEGRARL